MTKFVLNRDYDLVSTLGASVSFKKGVPAFVPPQLHKAVIDIGAEAVEGEAETEEGQEDAAVAKRPKLKADRIAQLNAAYEAIVLRAKKEDFTLENVPHASVVSKEVGWAVDAKERDDTWAAFAAGKD